MEKKKAVLFWSGGKDSALALYRIRQAGEYEVKHLVTTVNRNYKRVSMHGVREELLDRQAALTGIGLIKMYVKESTNREYEDALLAHFMAFRRQGIAYVIYGDIFLEDLRAYRDSLLQKARLACVYPLWIEDTPRLMSEFLGSGFRTLTCCVNDAFLDQRWVGRELDQEFISQLPAAVDPCGENGEFHTFCFAGPVFEKGIMC